MKIISISGLDGSGKTTQIKLLKKHFESKGKKVFYFHAIDFSIAEKLRKLFSGKKSGKAKGVVSATNNQIRLRKIAFLVDSLRFKFLTSKLEREGYDYLLSDRFFYDGIANISFLMHKNYPSHIEKFMPVSDSAIYLKTAPEDIMERRRIPEQGRRYLAKKKMLYDMYAMIWNFRIIDGSDAPEKVFKKILKEVKQ